MTQIRLSLKCGRPSGSSGAPHHLCLGVPGPSSHPKQTGAGWSISGSLATGLCGLRTHQEGQPAVPRYLATQGIRTRGTRQTSQKVEGRAMRPPCGLHSPHSDNTPEGKATGQPASGWRVPQVFLQPVSGTREPGGGDGGRTGLGARASCPVELGCTHSGSRVLPARPKYRAWSRVEARALLAARGLHLLSSPVLVKL